LPDAGREACLDKEFPACRNKNGRHRARVESMEKAREAKVPPLWDGKASERIGKVLGEGKC